MLTLPAVVAVRMMPALSVSSGLCRALMATNHAAVYEDP